jgi:hypothetical protein
MECVVDGGARILYMKLPKINAANKEPKIQFYEK